MSELDITLYRGCFLTVKQLGRDAEYVHLYSAEVGEWSCSSDAAAAAAAAVYLHFLGRHFYRYQTDTYPRHKS